VVFDRCDLELFEAGLNFLFAGVDPLRQGRDLRIAASLRGLFDLTVKLFKLLFSLNDDCFGLLDLFLQWSQDFRPFTDKFGAEPRALRAVRLPDR